MKRNSRKQTTETTAPPATPPQAQPPQHEEKPEYKPDFYARLMHDRPAEAASILATICRRKDKALRVMVETYKAGADTAECISAAMAVAFPKHKEAAP
jgi:hypothetical protein